MTCLQPLSPSVPEESLLVYIISSCLRLHHSYLYSNALSFETISKLAFKTSCRQFYLSAVQSDNMLKSIRNETNQI